MSSGAMEKQRRGGICLWLGFLLAALSGSTEAAEYQLMHVKPLKKQPAMNAELWSESQYPQFSASGKSIGFPLVRKVSLSSINSDSDPVTDLRARLARDSARVSHIERRVHMSVISGLPLGSAEYFARMAFGSPPQYMYMILDTGSPAIWLQCTPCQHCYNQSGPIFRPSESTTYSEVLCGGGKACNYKIMYGDGSFSKGVVSKETIWLSGSKLENVTIGCGHDNHGLFAAAAGILGVDRGNHSLLSQLPATIQRVFSYCLVDMFRTAPATTSWLIFGEAAVPSSANFTPMLSSPHVFYSQFYYVALTGISIGGIPVPHVTEATFKITSNATGGCIVDSGTVFTRLVQPAYERVSTAFRRGMHVAHPHVQQYGPFDTCYNLTSLSNITVPTVKLHLKGEVHLQLPTNNYFIPVAKELFCFAFAPSYTFSILGNIQQQGYRITYDVANRRVGFSSGGC